MVTIEVKNINGKTTLPVHGSKAAAGYDIIAIEDPKIVGEVANVREIDGKQVTFYRRIDYIEYKTGLFISPQAEATSSPTDFNSYHVLIHPRSSIRKYDLVLANSIALIDNDYRGEIMLCFKYTWQPDTMAMETAEVAGGWELTGRMVGAINYEKIYKKGDKIGQLVTEEDVFVNYKLVDDLDHTERGAGGFGSTDVNAESAKTVVASPSNQSEGEKFKKLVDSIPGASLVDMYQKSGGVPIKKRYIDEVKERRK